MQYYRNRNTDQYVGRDTEDPRLEGLPQWERVDSGQIPEIARTAADRAAAERRSIELAAKHRADNSAMVAEGAARAAAVSAQSVGEAQPNVTLASVTPDGDPGTAGGLNASNGATQTTYVGAMTSQEADARRLALLAKADADSRAAQGSTVLERARAAARSAAGDAGLIGVGGASTDEATTAASPATDSDNSAEGSGSDGDRKAPAKSASKADWVDYAVTVHKADADTVNGMSKDALIAEYGQKPAPSGEQPPADNG